MHQKTINMTKAQWDAWETALLSGEYPKAIGGLRTVSGFCCLGVLQMCLTGEVESDEGDPLGVPTFEWLEEQGITFFNPDGHVSPYPWISSEGEYVTLLNDKTLRSRTEFAQVYNFKQIAAFLKSEVEFI